MTYRQIFEILTCSSWWLRWECLFSSVLSLCQYVFWNFVIIKYTNRLEKRYSVVNYRKVSVYYLELTDLFGDHILLQAYVQISIVCTIDHWMSTIWYSWKMHYKCIKRTFFNMNHWKCSLIKNFTLNTISYTQEVPNKAVFREVLLYA